jgi:hypothetical protein
MNESSQGATRLIVEAVSQEAAALHDERFELPVLVSVSCAQTGAPVSGLGTQDFRVSSPLGTAFAIEVLASDELAWEPADTDSAGCYSLRLVRRWAHSGEAKPWYLQESACFGVQVRQQDGAGRLRQGQTVLRIEHPVHAAVR